MNHLGIPAVATGLRCLEAVGVEQIHKQVELRTGELLGELGALRHRKGHPAGGLPCRAQLAARADRG